MTNDKWVKLFITTETQTVLQFTRDNGRWIVEANVMIDGEMHNTEVYAGEDLDEAQKAFDSFDREDANMFTESVTALLK